MMFFKKTSAIKMLSLKKDFDWKSLLGRNPRRFIIPGAGILTGLFIIFFVFIPVLHKIGSVKKAIEGNEAQLKELSSLSKRYKELKSFNAEIDRKLSKKGAKFELLSFLEEMAQKVGIGGKISSMKPTEGEPHEFSASVVLKDLNMEELTDYLYQILHSELVLTVKKMHLKVSDRGQKSLEASLVVSTLKSSHKPSSS